MISRRQFLKGMAGATTAVFGTGLYSWQLEPRWVDYVERPLPINNLPAQLIDHTLVQISDMHISNRYNWEYQKRAFSKIRELNPHFVVYTGDFVSYDSAEQYDQLATLMPLLPLGTYGTAAIFGNHDYGFGWRQLDVADNIAQMLKEVGITVLRNETAVFADLHITGLDDYWSPNYAPDPILAQINSQNANLILCHNPDVLDEPVWHNYQGWVLSGHTHGGQVKPPFLPPPILPVNNELYTAGEFDLGNGRYLYINRGLGSLWPIRFNARPEITIFTLTTASSI